MSSSSIPEGPGSVSGAPNLPAGFTGTFASRYVDTGELRLHAVTGGDGPPLLLVHGWPQTWYQFRLIMPGLARDFSVVAVDQRGIGLSGKPPGGYDTATLASDLVKLMDALGHPRFALYGTDVGMPIAYALAADHRDRVDRLVVSEAPLPGISPSPPLFLPPPTWPTFGGASRPRAGPARSSSPIGRRACSWRRSRPWWLTGTPATTGARARPSSTPCRSS
jgi:pimeloyl-ACP methyl ester carboxylesterase